jgi:hypothetical protein
MKYLTDPEDIKHRTLRGETVYFEIDGKEITNFSQSLVDIKNNLVMGRKYKIKTEPISEAIQWKDGIHKEGMETVYYSKTRRFVLRMTDDEFGEPYPVWILESHRPKKCCVCGTTENLHKDGWYGYRCDKPSCVCF